MLLSHDRPETSATYAADSTNTRNVPMTDLARAGDIAESRVGSHVGSHVGSPTDMSSAAMPPGAKADAKEAWALEDQSPDAEPIFAAPVLSLWSLFVMFGSFGVRAFGGPVAQIAMIKQQLVVEEKWISVQRFNRVLAVYQALPGPEATELCCYFGMLSRGRIGAVVAGLGFALPGFLAMLLLTWIYSEYGLKDKHFEASFNALQPAVAAIVCRAVHKISEHAFTDQVTHQFSNALFAIGFYSCLQSVAKINFFITLFFCGLIYALYMRRHYVIVTVLNVLGVVAYVLYAVYVGLAEGDGSGSGMIDDPTMGGLFALGLLAGLLTFGGAYTAIPFVQQDAVYNGGWMTNEEFLDGLALGSILPAPLVSIISTFVGYIGNGVGGATVMTIGIFLPAFSFTLIGHNFFEKLIDEPRIHLFLDGVTAAVTGLIAITALDLVQSTIDDPISSVIFMVVLYVLYTSKNKYTSIILMVAVAIAGQQLYL